MAGISKEQTEREARLFVRDEIKESFQSQEINLGQVALALGWKQVGSNIPLVGFILDFWLAPTGSQHRELPEVFTEIADSLVISGHNKFTAPDPLVWCEEQSK